MWLLGGFVLLTALVGAGWTQPVDDRWDAIMRSAESPWITPIAMFFHYAGGLPIALATTVVVTVVFLAVRKWWAAAAWVVMVAAAQVLSTTVKALVGRERPLDPLVHESSGAYPSGHALVSGAALGFGLAVLLAILWPRRARMLVWLGGIYGVLMAWSRTYLHAHWLTDVVGGLLAGLFVVFVVAGAMRARFAGETSETDRRSVEDAG